MKARFITASVSLIAVVALAFMPGRAQAATETGLASAAGVTCDLLGDTITVYAGVGASDMYPGQWLAARFWAQNVRTKRTFWLSPNGQWAVFYHERIRTVTDATGLFTYTVTSPWADYQQRFTVTDPDAVASTNYKNPGFFRVYAQYAWYTSTGWQYSGTYTTTSYTNPGWNFAGQQQPYCLL